MLYVKQEIGDTAICTKLNYENVFTKCPEYGKEIQIDLDEFYSNMNEDDYGCMLNTKHCCSNICF